jgi:hypothetical protein
MKLIRVLKETRTVVEIGEAHSSNEAFWPKDFRPAKRIYLAEPEKVVVEELRPPSLAEEALWED